MAEGRQVFSTRTKRSPFQCYYGNCISSLLFVIY